MGKVGDQERALDRNWVMMRRSALPVRMSYRMKVRSDPREARMDGSAALKRMEVTVSEAVEWVRSEMGVLLG